MQMQYRVLHTVSFATKLSVKLDAFIATISKLVRQEHYVGARSALALQGDTPIHSSFCISFGGIMLCFFRAPSIAI